MPVAMRLCLLFFVLLCGYVQIDAAEEAAEPTAEEATATESAVEDEGKAAAETTKENQSAEVGTDLSVNRELPQEQEAPIEGPIETAEADDDSKSAVGPKANNFEKGRLRERKSSSMDDPAVEPTKEQSEEEADRQVEVMTATAAATIHKFEIQLLDFGSTWLVYGSDVADVQISEALLHISALSLTAQVHVLANDGKFLILSGKQLSLFKNEKQALEQLVLQQNRLLTPETQTIDNK